MELHEVKALRSFAAKIRIAALDAIHSIGTGHLGGAMSICEVLSVLYGREMKYKVEEPKWPQRDKLVCSKGHAGPAVYGTLALKGFFPYEELKTLNYAISQITASGIARAGASAASTVIMMAVPIIVFVVSQSNIIETMGTSGMKD